MLFKNLSLLLILVFIVQCTSTKSTQNITDATSNKTVLITIEGMACQEGCADTIKMNLEDLKGVQSAEVSYDKKQAVVSFDKNTVSLDVLKNTITDTKVKDYNYTIKNVVLKNQKSE